MNHFSSMLEKHVQNALLKCLNARTNLCMLTPVTTVYIWECKKKKVQFDQVTLFSLQVSGTSPHLVQHPFGIVSLPHLLLCFFEAFLPETTFSISCKPSVSSTSSILRWWSSSNLTVLCTGSLWIPEVSSPSTPSCPSLQSLSWFLVSPSSCSLSSGAL